MPVLVLDDGAMLRIERVGGDLDAMIVVVADAPPTIRAQAFGMLDRLDFDPTVLPDWRSSG